MQWIRHLEKYAKTVSLKKTSSYKEIEKYHELLHKNHVESKLKNEYDIQATLIFLRGLLNKEYLFHIYIYNINENKELWELMSYQQRQILLHGQLESDLDKLPHFLYEQELILFPFFNESINHIFTNDYQSLLFKNTNQGIEQKIHQFDDPVKRYGIYTLINGFCDFILVWQQENDYYLYLEQWHALYVFNQEIKSFTDKIIILDKYALVEPTSKQLKEIAVLYYNDKEIELLQYLFDHQFISKKVFHKISRRIT